MGQRLLDRPEHILQVQVIDRSSCFEYLIHHNQRKIGHLCVLDPEALQKLWEKYRALFFLQHREKDLKRHFLKVGLAVLHFFEQEVVGGKRHALDFLRKAHVGVQTVECLVRGDQIGVLDHFSQ